jgi:hypothetical protein
MPSFSRTRTAASTARIFAISDLARVASVSEIIDCAEADLNEIGFIFHDAATAEKSRPSQSVISRNA